MTCRQDHVEMAQRDPTESRMTGTRRFSRFRGADPDGSAISGWPVNGLLSPIAVVVGQRFPGSCCRQIATNAVDYLRSARGPQSAGLRVGRFVAPSPALACVRPHWTRTGLQTTPSARTPTAPRLRFGLSQRRGAELDISPEVAYSDRVLVTGEATDGKSMHPSRRRVRGD